MRHVVRVLDEIAVMVVMMFLIAVMALFFWCYCRFVLIQPLVGVAPEWQTTAKVVMHVIVISVLWLAARKVQEEDDESDPERY